MRLNIGGRLSFQTGTLARTEGLGIVHQFDGADFARRRKAANPGDFVERPRHRDKRQHRRARPRLQMLDGRNRVETALRAATIRCGRLSDIRVAFSAAPISLTSSPFVMFIEDSFRAANAVIVP